METSILAPDEKGLQLASRLLKDGELVAFPTETVYGLGANAMNADAVRRIFEAKGRPADNPLIVHVYDRAQLDEFCTVPPLAEKLMSAFWPGPLTVLCPKKPCLPDVVTAGLSTVAVRMPSHPVAAAMLRACALPIAAPSANRSGRPSPTTAAHVMQDMDGRIPLILDGGSCDVGLESTVVDVCHGAPTILRPGGITRDMLEQVLGRVELAPSILSPLKEGEKALSPGMRYRHYAPQGSVTLVDGDEEEVIAAMKLLAASARAEGRSCCLLCFDEHEEMLSGLPCHLLGSKAHPEETAHVLFDVLRSLDDEHMECIYSEVMPPEGVGLAVMNRLGRAASFQRIQACDVLASAQ